MPFLSYRHALQLQNELKGTKATVVLPEDDRYAEIIQRWSDTSEREAGAVVIPTSSVEVSLAVAFATRHDIVFVVKGGGHSTSAASSTHGGIVIDLSAMNKVLVDPASATVAVQGGATWEEVDRAAGREGLVVVGCTTNAAGVGGTALGGGFGWLTGRYGLVIDNLISLKLVLADGRIVTASMTENPDLFWAARGAGQSFGVATELVLRAHRHRSPVFGGLLYFSVEQLNAVVDFASQFDDRATGDEGLIFGFTTQPPTYPSTVIAALIFYNGPRAAAESFFAPLLALHPIQNDTRQMPYWEMNTILARLSRPGNRKCIGGTAVTLPLDPPLLSDLYEDFDQIMRTYPRVEGSTLFFTLIPYMRVRKVAFDATAYANRGPYHNAVVILHWHDPELDQTMRRLVRELLRKIRQRAPVTRIPGQGVGAYSNYAGTNKALRLLVNFLPTDRLLGHDVDVEDLFGENLPRLQELKRQYDPKNMFRKWHNLVPANPR